MKKFLGVVEMYSKTQTSIEKNTKFDFFIFPKFFLYTFEEKKLNFETFLENYLTNNCYGILLLNKKVL